MSTNIIAIIFWLVSTNDFTLSYIQSPAPKKMTDDTGVPFQGMTLEYRPTAYFLSANIVSNQVMKIDWEGTEKNLILQSINIGTASKTEYR